MLVESTRWPRAPRPDPEVVRLFEQGLDAAKMGLIRTVMIVAVNPVKEVEHASAGDLQSAFRNALFVGLSSAASKLLNMLEQN